MGYRHCNCYRCDPRIGKEVKKRMYEALEIKLAHEEINNPDDGSDIRLEWQTPWESSN